jgi:hypothetical protein
VAAESTQLPANCNPITAQAAIIARRKSEMMREPKMPKAGRRSQVELAPVWAAIVADEPITAAPSRAATGATSRI